MPESRFIKKTRENVRFNRRERERGDLGEQKCCDRWSGEAADEILRRRVERTESQRAESGLRQSETGLSGLISFY